MKTKHLFLATALMASFAACTNEEIVSDVQQNVATGRPTVENVKLTFGENVDSRLVYNKGYKWESTDVIGALLMDTPNGLPFTTEGWTKATWNEKYTLSSVIHTSYPFTYNKEDKTWGCDAKMLEGNYFFAFPWESYDGNRQVAHSLIAQEQVGVAAEVRAESYANNQFFIGYDRIVAGTHATEALNNVEMTPVLGAIQLQIVNTGTQDYHINKVVLKGEDLGSVLTFDPMNAVYDKNHKYNYSDGKGLTAYFNSANYLGLDEEDAYNADKDYDKEEALLAVVNKLESDHDKFSQLYIKGTEEERLLEAEAGNTAYVLIMATPDEDVDDLTLDIYTDEGVVVGVDLTTINKEIKAGKSTAITSAKVKKIGPDVVNTIKVQIDDNSFNVPTVMPVYNNDDLLQFIQWNANEVGAREVYAVLEKDVTLTSEMIEALAENKNIELFITGDHEITLAEDLDADVLDSKNLTIAAVSETTVDGDKVKGNAPAIKVLGELALTKYSDAVGTITVVKDAKLSIVDKQVNSVTVINEGTLSIGTKANIKEGKITNYAEMTVDADAYVKVDVDNYGNIENNGTINVEGVANKKDATITLGEDALLVLASNEGLVITEDGAKVTGDNTDGRIQYEDGANVDLTSGIIYREVKGAVTNEPVDANNVSKTNVNTWVLVGDATFAADAKITNVEVDGSYDITVAEGKKLEITGELSMVGNTVTDGTIIVGSILVEEDAEWTNLGSVTATTIDNKGAVDNKETVYLPYGSDLTPGYDWEGNDAIEGSDPNADNRTAKQKAMDSAVAYWASQWTRLYTGNETQYFNGNPYDFETFIACMNVNNNEWSGYKTALVTAYYKTSSNTDAQALAEATLKMFGADCEDFEPAEFKDAVQAILKGTDNVHLNAAKKALIDDNAAGLTYGQFKKYNNAHIISVSTDVYEDMTAVRNGIAKQTFDEIKTATNFNTAMALWVIEPTDIEAAIEATEVENWYMLESDDIVAVARLYKKHVDTFDAAYEYKFNNAETTVERIQGWFNSLYGMEQTTWSEAQKDAWTEIKAYKSFIEGLVANEYTPAQLEAAAQPANY